MENMKYYTIIAILVVLLNLIDKSNGFCSIVNAIHSSSRFISRRRTSNNNQYTDKTITQCNKKYYYYWSSCHPLFESIRENDDDTGISFSTTSTTTTDAKKTHTLTISYEGQTCDIIVYDDETILSALERQSYYIQTQLTSLPTIPPSDCRRGNCLTCVASIQQKQQDDNTDNTNNNDNSSTFQRLTDGLSPTISDLVRNEGYVLTCSTLIQQSGGHIILNQHQNVWDIVYQTRYNTDSTISITNTAIAKVMRKASERNIQQWVQETEKSLFKGNKEE